MKNLAIRIMVFVVLSFLSFSCGPGKQLQKMYGYEKLVTMNQIDSICVADTLPKIEKWISSIFYDYETNEEIIKRIYIKEYNSQNEFMYILLPKKDSLFLITKRVVKTE